MKVFLSYTRLKDQFSKVSEFRERLQQELELRDPGSQVFQDKKNLQEGQHFPEELQVAVSDSDFQREFLPHAGWDKSRATEQIIQR